MKRALALLLAGLAHPEWLADDGVHVSAAGYRARAKAVARIVRRCE